MIEILRQMSGMQAPVQPFHLNIDNIPVHGVNTVFGPPIMDSSVTQEE